MNDAGPKLIISSVSVPLKPWWASDGLAAGAILNLVIAHRNRLPILKGLARQAYQYQGPLTSQYFNAKPAVHALVRGCREIGLNEVFGYKQRKLGAIRSIAANSDLSAKHPAVD